MFQLVKYIRGNRTVSTVLKGLLIIALLIHGATACSAQSITGETMPVAGIDYTYSFGGNTSGSTWTITNGVLVSLSGYEATVRFNQPAGGPQSYGSGHIHVVTSSNATYDLDVTVAAGLSSAHLDVYPTTTTPGNTVQLIAAVVYDASQYSFNYQWQVSYNEGYTWSTFANNNSYRQNSPALTQSALFRVIVTGGINVITTNTFEVIVAPPVIPGAMEPDVSLAPYGGNSMDTLKAQPSTGGTGSITYQWQDSSAAGGWMDIPGATALKYLPVNITSDHWYRLKSTSGAQSVYSIKSRIQMVPADPVFITQGFNYIISQKAMAPEKDSTIFTYRPVSDAPMTVRYFDGLGRPVQTIQKKGSLISQNQASGDLVTLHLYDGYGRDSSALLPYVAATSDGRFKDDALTAQPAFYEGPTSPDAGQGEVGLNARSIPIYEQSPLSRSLEQFAPGNSWAGTVHQTAAAARHSVKQHYRLNTHHDSVCIWSIGYPGTPGSGLSTPGFSGYYQAGTLFKNVVEDEAGNQLIEYKDKQGQVILKKVQHTALPDDGSGSTTAYEGWLCTYYIYDNTGNLRCVIQPEGVAAMAQGTWSLTTSLLDEQCFRYEYDSRNRMIIKKVPGAGPVYMVYDNRNRLVMTQDANMRPDNLWIGTKYDLFNRPDSTWLESLPGVSFIAMLSEAAATDNYRTADITANNLLTVTHYDDYTGFTPPSGLSITYKSTWNSVLMPASATTFPYPEQPEQITASTSPVTTKGKVTWTKTRVLGTEPATFITSINIYDKRGRVIQTQQTNITGGTNINTTQYSFAGQPLVTVSWQSKLGTRPDTSVLVSRITYDKLWRQVKTEVKQSNSRWGAKTLPTEFVTLSSSEYGSTGMLTKKYLGHRRNTATAFSVTPLESQTYEYNVRGWLLGVNRPYARDASSTDSTTITTSALTFSGEMFTESTTDLQTVSFPSTNFFGFDLGYDRQDNNLIKGKNYLQAQYTGNITGMVWKSAYDEKVRKYDFTYDRVNRLTGAAFGQYQSGGFSTANVDYSVSGLSYDRNGNILTMSQYGLKTGSTSAPIDNLSYHYMPGSNQLKNVVDGVNDPSTLLGDFHYASTGVKLPTATDYTYDENGNLHSDANKNITQIDYNFLNLPERIVVAGQGTINYIYDAAGNKLQKTTITDSVSTTTTYLGSAVYVNDTLQFFNTAQGRSRPVGNMFVYDYFLNDHLGNTRMVITDDYNVASPILEANSYYPFGLQQKGIGLLQDVNPLHNRYTYNGKELQEDLGLDQYDYGARFYDAQIGRWHVEDPLSEKSRQWSPYNYAYNSPIRFIDPDGMESYSYTGAAAQEAFRQLQQLLADDQTDDWIKNNMTGEYEWDSNVKSKEETPSGYTYVGKDGQSILHDLGWDKTYQSKKSITFGYVAASAGSSGGASYGASHMIGISLTTAVSLEASVYSNFNSNGRLEQTFLGVSVKINTTATVHGTDVITPTGNASVDYNGSSYTTSLGKLSDKVPQIKSPRSNSIRGSILIPASAITPRSIVPSVNVKGYFINIKRNNSGATAVSYWGGIFLNHTIIKFSPTNKKSDKIYYIFS